MICFVELTDYREINKVKKACCKSFSVKALSLNHAIKKAMLHLGKHNIHSVDESSATTENPVPINSHLYPLVTINNSGVMKGNSVTRIWEV